MKTKTFLLLLFPLLLLLCSCEREDCPTYKLPPATQTGANTFGCLINDVVFVPRMGGLFSSKPKSFSYNEKTGELYVYMIFYADDRDYMCGYPDITFKMEAYEVYTTGEVPHGDYWAKIDYNPEKNGRGESYSYNSTLSNLAANFSVTKLDTIENLITGTFWFESSQRFPEVNSEKKLYVTEGRFDFLYNQDGSLVDGYHN